MGIQGGAKNLGRDDIGQVVPGFAADLAGWKVEGNIGFAGAGRCLHPAPRRAHDDLSSSIWWLSWHGFRLCNQSVLGLGSALPDTFWQLL